ncbi:MAG TPA: HRDC domain-containing protein [Pseudonocardiaceae bacterium]|nr:HRDC domain-containing protein [Pseudonocardiaceae bacterium]
MTETAPAPVPLLAPAAGVPPVVASRPALEAAVAAVTAGAGPVAVDTERASGYRYWQRAYLVQIRRAGTGTILIDPTGLPDLADLAQVLNPLEWVLHAASQDLPCLADLGLAPRTLFDTELAARLAGCERVGLGALVEDLLGYQLEKGHGAADWSRRPLPPEWLTYAALDVELLLPLRAALAAELDAQGKSGWAAEEFATVRLAEPAASRPEPWRRTSGMHRIHRPRQLAVVRELWLAREQLAQQRDIAPGRVLPDSAIIDAALTDPPDEAALLARPVFGGRSQRRVVKVWLAALQAARALPTSDLPTRHPATDGPPPVNRWQDRDPAAAARLSVARAALAEIAANHRLPVQNLLQPDLVRRLCWAPPAPLEVAAVERELAAGGARRWQRELTAHPLTTALAG